MKHPGVIRGGHVIVPTLITTVLYWFGINKGDARNTGIHAHKGTHTGRISEPLTFSRKTGMASTTTAEERGRASIM